MHASRVLGLNAEEEDIWISESDEALEAYGAGTQGGIQKMSTKVFLPIWTELY